MLAKDQIDQKACFVAGTLVHTKDGLKPIEEIKVGDFVLSKPETGEGELSYQRVTRTFVHENQEVWAIVYRVNDKARDGSRSEGWLAATKDHPFWQIDTAYTVDENDPTNELFDQPYNNWRTVFEMFESQGGGVLLANGDRAVVASVKPLVQNEEGLKDIGLLFDYYGDPDNITNNIYSLDFSKAKLDYERPFETYCLTEPCTKQQLAAAEVDSIIAVTEYPPFLRTVYNLEVEDYHTYFVGEHGIWVNAYAH